MNDLEITKLCAEAMGYQRIGHSILARPGIDAGKVSVSRTGTSVDEEYDPLHDDAQAMALVKKFGLMICKSPGITLNDPWLVIVMHDRTVQQLTMSILNNDLNRAIVECVSAMRVSQARTPPGSR